MPSSTAALGDDTLDLHRGGNTDSNLWVINFETVVPDSSF